MSRDTQSYPPEPWLDPEFSRFPGGEFAHQGKGMTGPANIALDKERRQRRFKLQFSIAGLMLLILGLGLLFDPMVGPGILLVLAAIALGCGVLLAAAALGMMGVWLFAAGDRLAAWIRGLSRWPAD